jgi:hypothetical protein
VVVPAPSVSEHAARAAARSACRRQPDTPDGRGGVQPDGEPGAVDYGLLYTSGSDHGFSNGGGPNSNTASQTRRLDSINTAILRIDPRSPAVTHGTKGLGDYTIPMANKFAADGDPKRLGEIYDYGFRNAHRLSWNLTDGTMFASDIGMDNVEEINIVATARTWMASTAAPCAADAAQDWAAHDSSR